MASRGFTEAERAAFVDGASVLVPVGIGWTSGVVSGPMRPNHTGEEYVTVVHNQGSEFEFTRECYPTGVRSPGAVEGIDYVWETREGKRCAVVLFCTKCGSASGRKGRSIFKAAGDYGYDVAWGNDPVPRGFSESQPNMGTPSVIECACWLSDLRSYLDEREYWRRVNACTDAGIKVWDVPAHGGYPYRKR